MSTKTETLHDCPHCHAKKFTERGLTQHLTARHPEKKAKALGSCPWRKALTIAPAPGDPHAIELSALNLVAGPTASEEFAQARIYIHALEGMAHGMAAVAVVLGAELQRLHKLFGVRAGRPEVNSRSRSEIKWPELVQRELGVSDDTARNWMLLAEQARKRLPDFAPVAAKLLATPMGMMPELQRAELVEKTRKLLPEESARQLMLEWGIVKKARAKGGDSRVPCPHCQKKVKADATACPHCGKAIKNAYDPNAPIENARDLLLHPLRTIAMRWAEKEAKLPLWTHLPPEELREIDGILLDLRNDLKAALAPKK